MSVCLSVCLFPLPFPLSSSSLSPPIFPSVTPIRSLCVINAPLLGWVTSFIFFGFGTSGEQRETTKNAKKKKMMERRKGLGFLFAFCSGPSVLSPNENKNNKSRGYFSCLFHADSLSFFSCGRKEIRRRKHQGRTHMKERGPLHIYVVISHSK